MSRSKSETGSVARKAENPSAAEAALKATGLEAEGIKERRATHLKAGRETRRTINNRSKGWQLLERIISQRGNMRRAFERGKIANKGSGGVDGVEIEGFKTQVEKDMDGHQGGDTGR